ncbi:phosphatidate cytidylyltransferase [Desulfuribacillus alkaliarsenatis]|uniref:Phosphatidate cytidylyltransferase n=1 Tax=Desulfuribacillus alkaliarsenatis TaxID=766136 RepID=A0A1E5G604_9FIRM|nr:phosphatidate cytidylyltransferase [Desulfuribacillus alkaliarsenatis]OEF98637.1 hypothetical protein BHF68_02950 [Desulfuribacillus alkaliarsenatis]
MKQRIITGIIGGIAFLSIIYVGQIYLLLLITLLALIGMHELQTMKFAKATSIASLFAFALVIIIFGQSLLDYNFFTMEGIILTLLIALIIPVLSSNRINFDQMAFAYFSALYIGIGFYSIFLVREHTTFLFTVMILLAIWATDTGAYFTGSLLKGRGPKLWESISPKKTVAGAVGGTLLSVLVIILLTPVAFPTLSYSQQILLGFVIAIIGQVGDLVESAYKRSYNIKDSGKILPGHGGILDRFDSVLFVFPVVYVFILYI